ncbi:Phage QLRG family, putative DNA packaging protein [Desulfosporosinus youngiae DSM 17734]|uniref:Phage QLRG family, putative DNA packaging protein n=2 Tax=Desulfosporosinus TaxID=79206 RepID=H5Y2L8_9FIRM|nr:Phage QLRG family, putative DNA packaging protein [Desulfosporosinus youngiae DSM 17734]
MHPSDPSNQETILTKVKNRLELKTEDMDSLIKDYIEELGWRILHYCNLLDIPNSLKFTWVSMTIDAVRIDLPHVDEISDTVGGSEAVKIGDTQVSPGRGDGVSNTSKDVIDKVVLNYRIDLNRYRKLRW